MTVSTAYSVLQYAGNGATTAFAVTWPFLTGSLVVTLVASTGIETTQTLGTHYTVSGGTDSNGLPAVGTVTMITAPASGQTLRIARATPKTQATTWGENDAFPQKTIEAALDKLLLITQEGASPGTVNDGIGGDVMELVTSGATDYWDAESQIIRNVADATANTDAVNYGQLQAFAITAGAGDVVGPISSVDHAAAVFDGVTGKLITGGDVVFSPKLHGAVGDGTTNDRGALAAADTAAVAASGVIVLGPGTYSVGSNLTIASRIVFAGGVLKPASGVTITLDGEITAPEKQVFDVSAGGTIAGSGNIPDGKVRQVWWGGIGNGSTNNNTATAAAVAFLKQRTLAGLLGGILQYGLGKFVHTAGVTIDFSGCQVHGIGQSNTYILMSGTFTMFDVEGAINGSKAAYGTAFRDLTIDSGTAKPTGGIMIYLEYCQKFVIERCQFLNPYRAIHCFGCEGPLVKAIRGNSFVAPASVPAIASSALIYLQGDSASGTTGLNERFFIEHNTGGGIGIDYGLLMDGFDTVKLTGNHLHGPASAVLFVNGDAGTNCYNLQSTNNTWEGLITYADYAVRIKGSAAQSVDSLTFTNDQLLNGTTAMVQVEGTKPHGVSFTSCHFKQADQTAIVLEGGTNLKVIGCEFLDANIVNSGSPAFITVGGASGGPADVTIAYNSMASKDFAHTIARGIYLRYGTGISVDGNKIRDVTTAIYSEVGPADFTCANNDIGVRRHTIASAITLVIPLGCDRAYITGTTTILSIDNSAASGNSSFDGREVELIFAANPIVSSGGGNLIFSHANNFDASANNWVRLRYDADDTAWKEVARKDTAPIRLAPAPVTGRYIGGQGLALSASTTAALQVNTLYATPFIVGVTTTWTRIGIEVTSAVAGNVRLGIYRSSADGTPAGLVLDAGTVSSGTTGIKEVTISQALTPGFYWLGAVSDATATVRTATPSPYAESWIGVTAPGAGSFLVYRSFTYGALPTPWGTPLYSGGHDPVMIWMRVA